MPGVALIFAKDGAPVSERRLRGLAARMAYRGDVISIGATNGAAVAHFSRGQRPIGSTAHWHVALDGRIDNRIEVAGQLDLPSPHPNGDDDTALIAAALERWDRDAAARLIGDFAIAALHRAEARALLIRDVRGLRPLYYRDGPGEFLCTSDLQSLVRDQPAAPNEGLIAEWLTGAPTSHSETVFDRIHRVPMAHYLEVARGSTTRRQYWMPAVDASITTRSDAARATQFAGILKDAVGARTVGVDRTALWLSGGLDSSTLAAMLHDSYRGRWQCFTLVHPASGIDEREFAAPVAAAFDAGHTIVDAPDVTRQDITDDIAATLDLPSPPNGLQSQAGRRLAVAGGFPIALSGLGSDEWFGGSFLSYADLAKSRRYLELMQTVWADRDREESTRVRLQIAAWSLCPPWLQRGVRAALNRTLTPTWISPRFARSTNLEDRLRACEIAAPDFALLSQRALYADNIRGGYVAGTEMQERANAYCGLDERYPFHDRRMIEFSLALPESDRWSGGRYKGVIRRAMADRLPRSVIDRQQSPNANALVAATLRQLGGRSFFERMQIVSNDWIDHAEVMQLWDRLAGTHEPGVEVWQLWAVAAMELWWVHAASSTASQGATSSVA